MGKPNILLLFTDMQRFDTIHALGNPIIKTPNLDRLVREGTAFTCAYSPSPVCVPARCCMHYGQYPTRTGLTDNGIMPEHNHRSMADLLNDNGYVTQAIGKCHFTPDVHELRGFQKRLTQEEGISDPATDDYCKWLSSQNLDYDEPHGTRGEMYYVPQVSLHDENTHPSSYIGSKSVEFIHEQKNQGKPWMLFSSFIHPHPPMAPPKPWHKLYRSPDMELPPIPDNCAALLTWINRHQNRYKYRDQGIDKNLLKQIIAYYYASISFVDFQVGRILSALEEDGILDNTMIIFSSDHGEYLGSFNCYGKRSMHDPSARIPLTIRYPERFEASKICAEPATLVDILPTVAASIGADVKDWVLDGVDLKQVIDGTVKRKYVYSQFSGKETGIYMILSKKWKYFYSAGDDREFLFDRKNDPGETTNQADNPKLNEMKEKLRHELLIFLQTDKSSDAVDTVDGELAWRKYPKYDFSYLEDPKAALLFQDHDAYILKHKGYTC
jgi:choline-sulfatase